MGDSEEVYSGQGCEGSERRSGRPWLECVAIDGRTGRLVLHTLRVEPEGIEPRLNHSKIVKFLSDYKMYWSQLLNPERAASASFALLR